MSNKFSKLKSILQGNRRNLTLAQRKARKGWFFVLPFVLGLVLLYLPIVIDSIAFSFSTITKKSLDGITFYDYTEWVGLTHFKAAFNETFFTSLGEGILNLIWEVPAIVVFSLFVAVILNQKMFGRAAFRAIFFVPVIISTGLMEVVNAAANTSVSDSSIETGLGTNGGADSFISMMDVQILFSNMKVGTQLVTYVIDLVNSIYDIVNYSGVQMLIFLAGLQSVSPAIYEASRIDGASSWETFWKITFPMVSPMIFVNAIYTIIDSFTRQSNVVMTTIQDIYAGGGTNQNIATAQAWTYFIVVMLIVGVFAAFASAFVFYQKRDS